MSFLAELRRRNVIRVAVAYCVAAWVIAQVAEFAFENFGAPDWALKSLTVLLLLGLPLAVIFAWAYELTPEGIRREREVDPDESITPQTGRKLDRAIIAVLIVAVAWFAWDKFFVERDGMPTDQQAVEATEAEDSTVLPAPSEKSIAVLPFVAMSSGEDDEYFADGLTEEILNSLAQLPELLVTARTSAFSFKGQDIPVQEIAAALGVRHIVEGSVRRSGDRVRVTAQLIRADDAFHLWSDNYDAVSSDTISVQEDIAEQIAATLDVVLDEKRRKAMRDAGLRDAEAYTLLQKGLDWYTRAHGEMDSIVGLERANEYFDQVIERVPDFAPVYALHSDLNAHRLTDDALGAEIFSSEEEIRAALDDMLDDLRATRRHARTADWQSNAELDLAFVSGDWRGIGGKIRRVVDNTVCQDGSWLSLLADPFGYSEEMQVVAQRRLACDPRRSISWFVATRTTLRAGNTDEALRLAREGMDIAPGAWLATAYSRALVASGQHEKALEIIDDKILDPAMANQFRAMVTAHRGDLARYDEYYALAEELDGSVKWWKTIIAAWGGRREDANRMAALIDAHPVGHVALVQLAQWCGCGAPWDLEVTPNFAKRLEDGGIDWPPPPTLTFPAKDW